jgi:hypothetical protein
MLPDPGQERTLTLSRGPLQLLGAPFLFESNSEALVALVDHAYAGLPPHVLPQAVPQPLFILRRTHHPRDAVAALRELLGRARR